MNKNRRKAIERITDKLMEIQTDVEEIRDEEQEAYDNLPESIQDGERGEEMEGYIELIEDALNSIEEAIDYLNEIL